MEIDVLRLCIHQPFALNYVNAPVSNGDERCGCHRGVHYLVSPILERRQFPVLSSSVAT